MERMTYRDARGEAWYSADHTRADFLHRLTEYEDTGLTPEEIEAMKQQLTELKELWDVLPINIQGQAIQVRNHMIAMGMIVPSKKEEV